MSQYLKFILELILIVFIVLFFYVLTIDLFIFNRAFLEFAYLSWLFYLLPILLSLIFLLGAVFFKNYLFKGILIVLSNSYLALSFFMILGVYCEEEKNLSSIHILIVILISLLLGGIHFKKLLPGLPRHYIFLVGFASIIVLADLYFTLISYDLFYVNLMTFLEIIYQR
ncbi:hypothetical protein SAMN04488552_0254 [Christiangramia echinicola]|uniref:Uncharacterized protein n=1 Tax=Christiangramia echinicola TaxID=279359 RepID=A0A1H1KVX9_9FLAO|nr:hypothetical protein SAMN04488552_0254 [Christiangramia echinicola]